jgi:hypothetical protein
MRRFSILVVLALVAGLTATVGGAKPASASNGTLSLTVGTPSPVYGEPTTLVAHTSDASGSCTNVGDCDYQDGSVAFYDVVGTTETLLGTEHLTWDLSLIGYHGIAELDYCCLRTVVDHRIHAYYIPGNFDSTSVLSDTFTVAKGASATTLAQSSTVSGFGESVTFNAHVTGSTDSAADKPTGFASVGEVLPGGTVSYGTAAVGTDGYAVIRTSQIPPGNHSLIATYSGDGNYNTSASTALSHTVRSGASDSVLTTSATSTTFGQPVTLTDTVTAVSPAFGTPTGTVTFNEVGSGTTLTSIGSKSLSAGIAALTLSTLPPGSHTIQGTYGGDASFLGDTSNNVSVTVVRATTTTALRSSANPSTFGQAVTFTATISPVAPGGGTPDGTVQFKDGGVNLGPARALVSGVATFATSSLGAGSHAITAVYSGAANYNGSSGALTQTVTCTKTITGSQPTVDFSPTGSTCLSGANITGGITIPAGAKVSIVNSTIGGGITSNGAGGITICGSTVGGSISITGANGFVLLGDAIEDACVGNRFRATVTLSSNSAGLNLGDNSIGGHVYVTNNIGAGPAPNHPSPEVEANSIAGRLTCTGNSPVASDDGRPSSSSSRAGECAAPEF